MTLTLIVGGGIIVVLVIAALALSGVLDQWEKEGSRRSASPSPNGAPKPRGMDAHYICFGQGNALLFDHGSVSSKKEMPTRLFPAIGSRPGKLPSRSIAMPTSN